MAAPALAAASRGRTTVILAFGFALAVVIALTVASLAATRSGREARAWVDHTHEVLDAIATLRAGLATASAAVRGHLLTADPAMLSGYPEARSATAEAVDAIARLTVDQAVQRERVARLRPLVAERLELFERMRGLVADGTPPPLDRFRATLERAGGLGNDIAGLLDDMRATELALLAGRDARAEATARRTAALFASGGAFGAGAVVAGLIAILHQMRRRGVAEAALQAANAELETRVAARTRDLAASRERLALAHAVARIGTFDWELGADHLAWSPELEAVFGLAPGSFEGRYEDWARRVEPEDLPRAEAAVRRAIERRERLDIEYRIRRPDGAARWIHAIGQVIGGAAGRPDRFIGLNIDVTEAKAAHAALVESERRYRFLAESMPQIVWTANPDGGLDYLNQVFADYIGAPIEVALGASWATIVHPDDLPGLVARWRRSLATGEDHVAEHRIRRHDGVYRWHLARARCLRGPDGAIVKWFGTSTDIEDQKARAAELERTVAERTRELRAANAELESFSYSVSHDLRTPLRAIEGFGDAVIEDCGAGLGPGCRDHLERIRAAARRMGEIIDALLTLSRTGRAELKVERVDVAAIAAAVIDDLRRADPGRAVEPVIAPCAVSADARLVRTVLENLIGNAWKFTREAPVARIEVACEPAAPGMTAVRVADNGVGFDAAHADKIFLPFKRLHDPARFPGSGIGLATVRRIVERHGGAIRAEGAPGRGAAFVFTLPAPEPR